MKIAIIGPGKMGTMIARRLIQSEFCRAESVRLSRVPERKCELLSSLLPDVHLLDSNAKAVHSADIIFMCVRPDCFSQVATDISGTLKSDALVISVMTKISIDTISSKLEHAQVIRTSTNIGIELGVATTFWTANPEARESSIQLSTRVFEIWGDAIHSHDENWLDVAIAGVGSGPALVIEVLLALSLGMVTAGMPHDLAQQGAISLLRGTAALCADLNGGAPEELQRKVTTPGGITAEALLVLAEGGCKPTFVKALLAACNKVQQLGTQKHRAAKHP